MKRVPKWRTRLRSSIDEEGTEARKSISRAKDLALRKHQVIDDEHGIPRTQPLTIEDELRLVGAALSHLQEAENHFGQLRTVLTRYRERLESEHEIELAHGPELLAVDLNVKAVKPKRPPRAKTEEYVAAAYRADVERFGVPTSSWGISSTCNRIADELHLSPKTVRRYLREELTV